ncbi:hypothetical protein P152DRAFT_445438 [Eremomyces bilateralis CBS 781.70]|uniref:Uncharacterized protein n=1 Tax=Eremomyces bilateralis CBS 781.70 TaxID=1392243 RepID=A0A6G1GH47_9PEZI|nr:uncharacterized protein P152DRAFT_445438 [Eremomyces bilateralis CBS 781.70]KAF1817334.1 hypothetical protein P152DRAFT_445438 [Eremomyces bilateralis CBS 781.70]
MGYKNIVSTTECGGLSSLNADDSDCQKISRGERRCRGGAHQPRYGINTATVCTFNNEAEAFFALSSLYRHIFMIHLFSNKKRCLVLSESWLPGALTGTSKSNAFLEARQLPYGHLSLTEDLATDDVLKKYAILSHTWKHGEEVTLEEFINGTGKNKAGYKKIEFCGEQAAPDGLEHF